MLLDIEMPRMDGFEVASLVRHNPNLTGLPIIMITSRTGEKHRERAFQIGVNCYMGKPFQEQQLLDTIGELPGGSRGEISAMTQTTIRASPSFQTRVCSVWRSRMRSRGMVTIWS